MAYDDTQFQDKPTKYVLWRVELSEQRQLVNIESTQLSGFLGSLYHDAVDVPAELPPISGLHGYLAFSSLASFVEYSDKLLHVCYWKTV